jgi:hypothetical protein
VIIVGGGYGGAATAKALDDIADVVLIEPKEEFVHNIAALRGLVDPEWTDRIFYPYRRCSAAAGSFATAQYRWRPVRSPSAQASASQPTTSSCLGVDVPIPSQDGRERLSRGKVQDRYDPR